MGNYFHNQQISNNFMQIVSMNLRQFVFLCLFSMLSACNTPKPFIFKGLTSIKIEKASFRQNVLLAHFAYENPNSFSLTLNKIDCTILINDAYFTTYTLDTVFKIPANATFELPAKIEVELSNIMKNSIDLLMNRPLKISVTGISTLSKGAFTKTIPIQFETTQKLNLGAILSGG